MVDLALWRVSAAREKVVVEGSRFVKFFLAMTALFIAQA
jgi:hypothetical protein